MLSGPHRYHYHWQKCPDTGVNQRSGKKRESTEKGDQWKK